MNFPSHHRQRESHKQDNYVQILDNRQCRAVIPEIRDTNEASLSFLRERLSAQQRRQGDLTKSAVISQKQGNRDECWGEKQHLEKQQHLWRRKCYTE